MRVVALVSGGKDSCYCMQLCKQHGHDVIALANLLPEESAPDELDSFCFQTVGHQLVGAYAACTGLPLFRKRIAGTSSVQDLGYSPTDGDEVEDLFQLLSYVKDSIPGVQAVASGAIASDYQRLRVENVCSRLNLVSLAYLWHQPQRLLLRGMVESGLEAILIKVACLGLQPRKHLGRSIAALEPTLLALADTYGCNVCGEGGEYETLTLDCPMFTRGSIELEEFEIVHGTGDVGYLVPKVFNVVPKCGWEGCDLPSDVRHVPHDYIASPRFGRHSAPPGTPPPGLAGSAAASPTAVTPAGASSIAPVASGGGGGAASPVACVAASLDPLLQPVAPSTFSVQVSMCTGPDYVQLVCRALRTKSALLSDITECDTTAALHALLTTAQQELAAQHMDLHHCLFVHLFLANMGHFQAANGVYCKHFSGRDPPSRACVQVCLPQDCPVMCEFLLARGAAAPALTSRSQLPSPTQLSPRHTRRVLHVQSISSWAPSCIGPYSQANSYRGLVYLAGVIPLDPPVMTLVPGDITAQVLRAMSSCEAVAIAQRTTVMGAALGLTVYLAAAVGGSSGSGGGCGACSIGSAERNAGSSGGAEMRALARAAVEALLDHGLPGHPSPPHRPGSGPPGGASGRYHRSSTSETSSLTTPRGVTTPGVMLSGAGVSAPGSRRTVLLGADGLDEEQEEAAAAAAATFVGRPSVSCETTFGGVGVGGMPYGGAAAVSAILDPYLQPPEVRNVARPSVLYVTVPSLPRGSLVEIQPVCLDVEALSIIRKLAGHDSFARRRNSSHQDASCLNHYHHGQHGLAHPFHPNHAPTHGITLHSGPGMPASGITTWSELPPTPRGSMESATSRDSVTHGSSPIPWFPSGEVLSLPLPSHVISAAGFMSPDAGSLAGTPCAGSSMLYRQRSSGLLANGGGSGLLNRCSSPAPGGGLALPHPPPSTHASGKELLSPTLQHLLLLQLPQLQTPDVPLPLPAVPPSPSLQLQQQHELSAAADSGVPSAPAPSSTPLQRPRLESSGDAVALETPAAAAAAPRASYSGSSCSSEPLLQCNSLDGNILSFEVSNGGRVPSSLGLATSPLPQQAQSALLSTGQQSLHAAAPLNNLTASAPVVASGGAGGAGSVGQFVRARPAAITVPHVPFGVASLQASSFETANTSRAPAAGGGLGSMAAVASLPSGGSVMQPYGGLPPIGRTVGAAGVAPSLRVVPPVSTSNSSHGLLGSSSTSMPSSSSAVGTSASTLAEVEVATPASASAAVASGGSGNGGSSSSSDVMVTTVCCYNQVLRSLFHLPPAVFVPGVTTAQLTRRFRRAVASVLAAHGMDMSCLIWVRVWYEKGSVGLTDDEFGFGLSSTSIATVGGPVCGGGGTTTATRVQHALEDDDEDSNPGGHQGRRSASRRRRGSGSGDSSIDVAVHASAAVTSKLGGGWGAVATAAAATAATAAAAAASVRLLAATTVPAGAGPCSPGRPGSPAPTHVPTSPPVVRSDAQQPPASPSANAAGQLSIQKHHHQHHHHRNHHHHPHHSSQSHYTKSHANQHAGRDTSANQHQHFHVSWVPVHRVATNATPQPAACVAVLELLAALPTP